MQAIRQAGIQACGHTAMRTKTHGGGVDDDDEHDDDNENVEHYHQCGYRYGCDAGA